MYNLFKKISNSICVLTIMQSVSSTKIVQCIINAAVRLNSDTIEGKKIDINHFNRQF